MREFIQSVVCALEEGQRVELVTVLESHGSTPRGAGAMLAVFPDGRMTGTVGGGNVEYEAGKLAAEISGADADDGSARLAFQHQHKHQRERQMGDERIDAANGLHIPQYDASALQCQQRKAEQDHRETML